MFGNPNCDCCNCDNDRRSNPFCDLSLAVYLRLCYFSLIKPSIYIPLLLSDFGKILPKRTNLRKNYPAFETSIRHCRNLFAVDVRVGFGVADRQRSPVDQLTRASESRRTVRMGERGGERRHSADEG